MIIPEPRVNSEHPLGSAPVDRVLGGLERVRRSPRGWTARCPAHEDREPSLSIAEGDDGRVLLNCFAGCTVEAICSALRIGARDLFPPREDQPRPPRRRAKPYKMPRSVAEVLLESASFAETWELARLLARVPERVARQDVLSSWDSLTDRFDIAAVLSTARVIRGVAIFRYCDSKSVEDPAAVARAVGRLIDSIEEKAA